MKWKRYSLQHFCLCSCYGCSLGLLEVGIGHQTCRFIRISRHRRRPMPSNQLYHQFLRARTADNKYIGPRVLNKGGER